MVIEEGRNTRSFGRLVISLYEGAKTRVRLHSQLSEEFAVKSGDAPWISAVTFSFCCGGRGCH